LLAVIADRIAITLGKPVVIEIFPAPAATLAVIAPRSRRRRLHAGDVRQRLADCGPALYDKLPFDPVKDFAPISQIFVASNILVVHPDVPAKPSPKWSHSQGQTGRTHLRNVGAGTSQHLAAELFKSMAKIDIRRCLSRHDGARAGSARRPHHDGICQYREHAAAGEGRKAARIRGDVRKRSALVPDLPTIASQVIPDTRRCRGSPDGAGRTPQPIIDRLHAISSRRSRS